IGYNGMRAAQVDLEVETPSVVTINHADSWQAYGKYFWQMDPSNLETNQTIYIRSRTLPIFVPQDEEKTVTVGELEDWFPQRTYFSLENGILNEL
ncbi:hypothetical protein KC571_01565, partial [candidate division WWE3 bacterium]|nr:hypothetical protein [candidate division WWE3 bacterium]